LELSFSDSGSLGSKCETSSASDLALEQQLQGVKMLKVILCSYEWYYDH